MAKAKEHRTSGRARVVRQERDLHAIVELGLPAAALAVSRLERSIRD
jgi:hypothetical protein